MPMIKTILVPATGGESDAATFAAALAIARPFAAHLDMLYVRPDPVALAVGRTTDAGGAPPAAGPIQPLHKDTPHPERKAHQIFTRFCADAGIAAISAPTSASAKAPSAEWHVETGEEPSWMASYAVATDLFIAPRATGPEGLAGATLETVLLESGRPIL